MLFRVKLYTANRYEPSHDLTDTRVVGTVRAAELCAEALLAPHRVHTTRDCYHRDVGRAAYVTVTDRDGIIRHMADAPVTIVPSVGELGYTP
jgi:hypothetical protein